MTTLSHLDRRPLAFILATVLSALFVAGTAEASDFPAPVGRVNDFAGLLAAADREALAEQLAEVERETTAEIAVVTVQSLGGRPLEEYATALFTEWGIGKKGADNGVLILVAVDDRAMRIEVGYGLEGILPDGLAGSLIRESFLPRFREDDYRTGILDGTARVVQIVRRNETLTAEQLAALDAAAGDQGPTWLLTAFFAFIVSVGAFFGGLAARAKVLDDFFGGIVISGFGLGVAALTGSETNFFVVCAIGVIMLTLGIVLGGRPRWRRWIRGTSKGAGGSGWVSGKSGHGGSSSRSSGSSSFGGGRSGGGGASGRW